MSSTIYHCCVDLGAICRGDSFAINALRHYNEEAREMPVEKVIATAAIKRAQGKEAWPLCNHADELGRCKGHPQ